MVLYARASESIAAPKVQTLNTANAKILMRVPPQQPIAEWRLTGLEL